MGDFIIHEESFTLDGVQTSVTTSYSIGYPPTVTLDSVAQGVFQSGIDASGQEGWYWRDGSTNLFWDGVAPPAAGTLDVSYQSQLSNYVLATQALIAVTNRSGRYEIAVPVRATDATDAQTKLSATLRRSGTIVPRVKWQTETTGWFPGQVVSITETRFNLTGNFLIESVTSTAEKTDNLGHGSCFRRAIEAYKIVPITAQTPTESQPDANAGDPFRPESLFSSINSGGGNSTTPASISYQYDRSEFILGPGGNITAGSTVTNEVPVQHGGFLYLATIYAKTAPVGQTLRLTIKRNGVSLLKKDTYLTLGPGEANTLKRFADFYRDLQPSPIYEGDILSITAAYSASSTSGLVAASSVTVQLYWYWIG